MTLPSLQLPKRSVRAAVRVASVAARQPDASVRLWKKRATRKHQTSLVRKLQQLMSWLHSLARSSSLQ